MDQVGVFKSGDLNIVRETSKPMYFAIFTRIIEKGMALEFITAQNFGYNPKVIEGAIKIPQIVSNRTLIPDIVNRKFETAIDEPKLRHIFTSTDDIVCFAQFVVYSMAHNIVDKYEFHPKNSVQPIKKSNKSYQCLVNGHASSPTTMLLFTI